jgi:hypothetical protein
MAARPKENANTHPNGAVDRADADGKLSTDPAQACRERLTINGRPAVCKDKPSVLDRPCRRDDRATTTPAGWEEQQRKSRKR